MNHAFRPAHLAFTAIALVLSLFPATAHAQHDKDKLHAKIAPLFMGASLPRAEAIVAALEAYVKEVGGNTEKVLNNPHFAFDFMEIIGAASGKNLHKYITPVTDTKIKIASANTPVAKANWTLRHYAVNPQHHTLKSTAELLVSRIASSTNTNDADWNGIGNTGFTFFILAIDGKVPNRAFLNKCTHYAEFEFTDVKDLFVSGDWLPFTTKEGSKKQPHPGFRGSGAAVKAALLNSLTIDKSDPAKFLKSLDEVFGNFEVKVPGEVHVKAWIKK